MVWRYYRRGLPHNSFLESSGRTYKALEVAEKSQMQANDSGDTRTDAAYVLDRCAETKDVI